MGSHERELLENLDSIGVVRQADHGETFVANHCKKVLAQHGLPCSVLGNNRLRRGIAELFFVFLMNFDLSSIQKGS